MICQGANSIPRGTEANRGQVLISKRVFLLSKLQFRCLDSGEGSTKIRYMFGPRIGKDDYVVDVA